MLAYSSSIQHGIDVSDSDYPHVEAFLKSMFRTLKKEGFDIRVNHWGMIFLIEPARKIPIALSINKTAEPLLPSVYEEHLKESPYFQFKHAEARNYLSSLVLSYRPWRPGTKWRFFLLGENEDEFIRYFLGEMKAKISLLVSSPRHSISIRDKVSLEDVVTLLTYNHIKKNGRDQQPAWLQELNNIWIKHCEIFDGRIYFKSFGQDISYPLMKSDIVLLKKILPNIAEERTTLKNL